MRIGGMLLASACPADAQGYRTCTRFCSGNYCTYLTVLLLALEALLYLAGVGALHLHGLPLPGGALVMALLYFVSGWLFRLAGVAGLTFLFPALANP